ncbi:MAG: ankyrin repeat domain-containing protein [Deferribacteres bacterium]|nr:ankyrin repeat domain-containing protein [candidate division KSB1 bacterium]MCB9509774.1 ankyrin repeat domain-containing protein [Deferribacteres bacterium]
MKKLTPVIALVLVMFGCGQQGSSAPDVDLHMAALTGNLEAIQQHIQAGSDLNLREPTRGSTPLITAIVFDKPEVAKALIDAGADINLQNNEGSTPLITAAFFCRKEIVRTLLEKGADKTIQNNAGRTALDAVSRPFEEVKQMYDGLGAALAPLGLNLDYEYIKTTRPQIAEMLQ